MLEVPLTRKFVAQISDEDADLLQLKWQVCEDKRRGKNYARRAVHIPGTRNRATNISMHRIIFERMIGRPLQKHELVDHRDLDGLNNQRENLRLATHGQNMANNRGYQTSKGLPTGVCHHRRKYKAQIRNGKRTENLGYFDTPEDAHRAFCWRHIELHGEFSPYHSLVAQEHI